MATQNVGRVKPIFSGEYDPNTPYRILDFVRYENKVWTPNEPVQGVAPGLAASQWDIVVDGADVSGSVVTTSTGTQTVSEALDSRMIVINLSSYVDKTGTIFNQEKMDEAAAAAEGNILAVPPGTYLGSLRIHSNTTVIGAGMDLSIIKLPDEAPSDWHAITNEQNTGDPLTNNGNVNITIGDIQGDGNNTRDVTGPSGCAIQFANVTGLRAKNIKGYRGRLHCIDIASSRYASDGLNDYYVGASSDIVLENPVAVDPLADDAITTHFSHNITIINPQSYLTPGWTPSATTQGLEIDDGSYDVKVFGGYARGFTKGLQIKGHPNAVPARDVLVVGFTAEGNEYNYDVQRGGNAEDSARNVTILNCFSIAPAVTSGTYSPRHGEFRDYTNLNVTNLKCSGGENLAYGLNLISGLNNSTINASFHNVGLDSNLVTGLIRQPAGGTVGALCKIRDITAFNCTGGPVINSFDSTNGLDVDGVYAEQDGAEIGSVIRTSINVQTNPNTRIRNIRFGAGYASALIDEDGVDSITLESGASFGKHETLWLRANSTGGVAGDPQIAHSVGWVSGSQNLGPDEAVLYGAYHKLKSGPEYLGAYWGGAKHSSVDDDRRTDFVIGTRNTGDASPMGRWKVRAEGSLVPWEGNTYDVGNTAFRVRNIYLNNSPNVSSDGRLKQGSRSANNVEKAVAADLKSSGVFYQWKADPDSKQQFGWIAQTVESIFARHGLDANDYGMFNHDAESDGYSLVLEQLTAFIVCNS